MKLSIAIAAASIILRWDVPGPGTYYLFSSDGGKTARVEVANHVSTAVHAAFTVKGSETNRIFWAVFVGD